jgi:hypothetical protein
MTMTTKESRISTSATAAKITKASAVSISSPLPTIGLSDEAEYASVDAGCVGVSELGYYVAGQQVDVRDVSTKSKPSVVRRRSAYAGTLVARTTPAIMKKPLHFPMLEIAVCPGPYIVFRECAPKPTVNDTSPWRGVVSLR